MKDSPTMAVQKYILGRASLRMNYWPANRRKRTR